jgi:hypothetical protein
MHAFQKVSDSLEKLPFAEYTAHFNANPIVIVRYAGLIINALSTSRNKTDFCGDARGALKKSLSSHG